MCLQTCGGASAAGPAEWDHLPRTYFTKLFYLIMPSLGEVSLHINPLDRNQGRIAPIPVPVDSVI
jgi:hypothetical protein